MEEVKKEELSVEQKSILIWDLEIEIAKLKAKQETLKSEVQASLTDENGVYSSYKDALWEIHHKAGAVSTKFDEAAFKKAEPELYNALSTKYSKTSVGKDSWNWTKQNKLVLVNE